MDKNYESFESDAVSIPNLLKRLDTLVDEFYNVWYMLYHLNFAQDLGYLSKLEVSYIKLKGLEEYSALLFFSISSPYEALLEIYRNSNYNELKELNVADVFAKVIDSESDLLLFLRTECSIASAGSKSVKPKSIKDLMFMNDVMLARIQLAKLAKNGIDKL